jgi:hypothetical protein
MELKREDKIVEIIPVQILNVLNLEKRIFVKVISGLSLNYNLIKNTVPFLGLPPPKAPLCNNCLKNNKVLFFKALFLPLIIRIKNLSDTEYKYENIPPTSVFPIPLDKIN